MQGDDEGEPIRRLFYGDCLTFMRKHLPRASVDMIYVDQPFKPGRYNAIYKEETGRPLPQQVESPFDVWQLPEDRERVQRALTVASQRMGLVDESVEFARLWAKNTRIDQPRLHAYLTGMAERLQWMKAVLRPTGSIFVHCDPATLHHTKVMTDAVFGHANFRTEVRLGRAGADDLALPSATDPETILLYSGSEAQSATDLPARIMDLPRPDGHPWPRPVAMLERLIKASTKPGDVVFDPFSGSGSAIEAAERLGRQWIAVDAAYHTVRRTAKHCLQQRLGFEEDIDLLIDGMPFDLCSAKALCDYDPAQFERWAVEYIGGFVTNPESSAGKVTGRIYFNLPRTTRLASMVVRACSGEHAEEADLRELRSVLDRGDALLAGLIVMEPLRSDLRAFLAGLQSGLGDLTPFGKVLPRMQLLDLAQLLGGHQFTTPRGTRAQIQMAV